MATIPLIAKTAALTAALTSLALLHHGHVMAFIQNVRDALPALLPRRYRNHETITRPSLLQLHFGDPALHYEVWVQRKTRSIEVGLHFEGGRETNRRWADVLAPRATEIQAALGPDVELEQWTRSWTRVHESRPVAGDEWRPKESLTDALAQQTAARLARYVEVLEPIVREERKRL